MLLRQSDVRCLNTSVFSPYNAFRLGLPIIAFNMSFLGILLSFISITIPFWYLWWSNGPGQPMQDVVENKDPIIEYSENENQWVCIICNTKNEMGNNECIKCVEQNNLDTEGRLSS